MRSVALQTETHAAAQKRCEEARTSYVVFFATHSFENVFAARSSGCSSLPFNPVFPAEHGPVTVTEKRNHLAITANDRLLVYQSFPIQE